MITATFRCQTARTRHGAFAKKTSRETSNVRAGDFRGLSANPEGWLTRRSEKEVIQPQVPLRLPCYDFIPVTAHSVGRCLLAVGLRTSATNDFHDVTGGVYKARERIHGAVADAPLLAIPAS